MSVAVHNRAKKQGWHGADNAGNLGPSERDGVKLKRNLRPQGGMVTKIETEPETFRVARLTTSKKNGSDVIVVSVVV